jgi:2-polyprenyl-3-methyl-5-hydroxy-6-metoxy-1,4-benzoquinol methylase
MSDPILECLKGSRLYGDDFGPSELREWYEAETADYFNAYEKDRPRPPYGYHALNHYHGFRFLPTTQFADVLGFGSGNGNELRPIVRQSGRITIIDSSEQYTSSVMDGVAIDYVKPRIDGKMSFSDGSFDLICCFSALHHVPNVSTVLREFYRCMRPNAFALLREPVVSMGDWRRPRTGLTRNERGIPAALFSRMLEASGFRTVRERLCMCTLTPYLARPLRGPAYNYKSITRIDAFLSALLKHNNRYHPVTILQKARPVSIFYVLQKVQ